MFSSPLLSVHLINYASDLSTFPSPLRLSYKRGEERNRVKDRKNERVQSLIAITRNPFLGKKGLLINARPGLAGNSLNFLVSSPSAPSLKNSYTQCLISCPSERERVFGLKEDCFCPIVAFDHDFREGTPLY